MEDDSSRGSISSRAPGIIPEYHLSDRQRGHQNSPSHGTTSSVPAELLHVNQAKNEEVANVPFVVYLTIKCYLF